MTIFSSASNASHPAKPVQSDFTEVFTMTTMKDFAKAFRVVFFAILMLCAFFFHSGISEAGPNIQYQCNQVNLQEGVAVLDGILYNNGDEGAYVTDGVIQISVKNRNGNLIYQDSANFYGINVYLGPGEQRTHRFNIHSNLAHAYDGWIEWYCTADLYWNK